MYSVLLWSLLVQVRIQYGPLGKSFWWIFLQECFYEQKSRFSFRKPSQKTHSWRKGPCIKFPACFCICFFSAVLTDTACSVYPLGLVFWMCLSRRLQYLEIIRMQEWIVMSCSWFDRWETSVSQSQAWQRTVITHQTAVKRYSLRLIWIHLDFVSRGHILQEFQGHPRHFAFFRFKKGTASAS